MKKTILACMILSAINGVATAADPSYTAPDATNNSVPATTAPAKPISTTPATVDATSPAAATSTTSTVTTTTTPSDEMVPVKPSSTMPATPMTSTTSPMAIPATLDCTYQLSAQVTQVDPQLIKRWTEKAVEQSFTFDSTKLDPQIEKLKACYTSQGWQGFYDALKKSGNLTAITTQGLSVSAMVDGQTSITQNKSNEWKLTIPLNVVYQNKQQKLTQTLSLEVLVGRKTSGDLGIMQIVAVPKNANEPASPAASTPSADTQAPSTAPGATMPSTTPSGSTTGEIKSNDTDSNNTPPKSAEPATAVPAGTPSVNPPAGATP
jgi:hypothetical protein